MYFRRHLNRGEKLRFSPKITEKICDPCSNYYAYRLIVLILNSPLSAIIKLSNSVREPSVVISDSNPNRTMKWGIPDGTRDESTGHLIHDTLFVSTALCALLSKQEWGIGESCVVNANEPLFGLRDVF